VRPAQAADAAAGTRARRSNPAPEAPEEARERRACVLGRRAASGAARGARLEARPPQREAVRAHDARGPGERAPRAARRQRARVLAQEGLREVAPQGLHLRRACQAPLLRAAFLRTHAKVREPDMRSHCECSRRHQLGSTGWPASAGWLVDTGTYVLQHSCMMDAACMHVQPDTNTSHTKRH